MKKLVAGLIALPIVIGFAQPAVAANSQVVSGVSAYYRADLGYMVGWTTPTDKTNITGYTVTSSNGKTCSVSAAATNVCTYPAATIGYSGSYSFTVTTNLKSGTAGVSSPSNVVGAQTIPSAPLALSSETVSDTQINVAWVPASGTGNLSVYGYKVTTWKSDQNGQPITDTRNDLIVTSTFTTLTVAPSTMYIINVATCNALGCNSANVWTHSATTPITTQIQSIVFPTVISGGAADTTCFDSIYDANSGVSSSGTCSGVVANPATYPLIDPTATTVNDPVLATKFANKAVLSGFSSSYSLATWATIGISWVSRLTATSKSVTLGFTTTPHVMSTTPLICEVVMSNVMIKATGTCSVSAYVDGNTVFNQSNTASIKFTVTK